MTPCLSIPCHHRAFLLKALEKAGTIKGAAKLLGKSEEWVQRMMGEFGVERKVIFVIDKSKI